MIVECMFWFIVIIVVMFFIIIFQPPPLSQQEKEKKNTCHDIFKTPSFIFNILVSTNKQNIIPVPIPIQIPIHTIPKTPPPSSPSSLSSPKESFSTSAPLPPLRPPCPLLQPLWLRLPRPHLHLPRSSSSPPLSPPPSPSPFPQRPRCPRRRPPRRPLSAEFPLRASPGCLGLRRGVLRFRLFVVGG